ncbi:hypothetical protein [Caudoviricetes sp.]|nr:hypothetical protein [Caudoviricetes sp.]
MKKVKIYIEKEIIINAEDERLCHDKCYVKYVEWEDSDYIQRKGYECKLFNKLLTNKGVSFNFFRCEECLKKHPTNRSKNDYLMMDYIEKMQELIKDKFNENKD